ARHVAALEGAGLRIPPGVPDLDLAIRAGRGELEPVGAEGDPLDRASVALEREGLLGAPRGSNATSQLDGVQAVEREGSSGVLRVSRATSQLQGVQAVEGEAF